LQNTWIQSSVTFTVGATPRGSVGWILRDQNGAVLVNNTVTGVGTFVASEGDRVRPKWGIYRSLDSNHAELVPCAMYLDNLRGYQKA
jgi:chitin-binding protein